MNPPFAIETEKESAFVDYALAQMRPSGLLFAILPNEPITGGLDNIQWRKEVVSRHTVRAVIRMPDHLFVPVAKKGTYGLILEAHRPHRDEDEVFFGVLFDDEHAPRSKLKGPSTSRDNLEDLTNALRRFIAAGSNGTPSIPQEAIVSRLDTEGDCDFASERYLAADPTEKMSLRSSVRDLLFTVATMNYSRIPERSSISQTATRDFRIDEIFDCERGKVPPLNRLNPGSIPVITTLTTANGIAGYFDVRDDHIRNNCVTIALNGDSGHAFYHPYSFGAVGDMLVCQIKDDFRDDIEFALFVCSQITRNSWRYSWYRKATQDRLQTEVIITLPWANNGVDYDAIHAELEQTTGFIQLIDELKNLNDTPD